MTTFSVTRRRALRLALSGGVALATTAIALSGSVASTILAQQSGSSVQLIGVEAGAVPTTNDVPEVSTTELDSAGNPVNGAVAIPIVVQTVDLATGQVQTVSTPQSLPDGTPLLQSDEVVTGITTLVDGTIVLTIDPVIGAVNETNPTRIVLLRATPVALSVSGLKQDEQLGDVAGTSDGSLLGLVMKKNGTPPADLAQIDLGTGALTTVNKIQLPRNRSFRTLTQCPDGTLYTTAVQNGGDTNLVHLDLGQNKAVDSVTLTSNGSVWNSGLESLMCTGGSQPQLFALGAPRYVSPNAVYTVDVGSGAMTRVGDLDVAKATLARN